MDTCTLTLNYSPTHPQPSSTTTIDNKQQGNSPTNYRYVNYFLFLYLSNILNLFLGTYMYFSIYVMTHSHPTIDTTTSHHRLSLQPIPSQFLPSINCATLLHQQTIICNSGWLQNCHTSCVSHEGMLHSFFFQVLTVYLITFRLSTTYNN